MAGFRERNGCPGAGAYTHPVNARASCFTVSSVYAGRGFPVRSVCTVPSSFSKSVPMLNNCRNSRA